MQSGYQVQLSLRKPDAFPVTVMDDFGNEVTLEKAPESIVSLAPVDTEILFALGAGDSVTGRTDYCIIRKKLQM